MPQGFQDTPNVLRSKDLGVHWAKKNNETHYGYQNHACVDNRHKLIRGYTVTTVAVHDSNVFHELLIENSSQNVWADSDYYSENSAIILNAMGY
ncbi:transposase [Microbulbifer sp. 2304DJ12-6]|uniref:transposase n=1 Tax=Microbulbifer sp. 2304DJ12-6 TaxID=3233340 RepID=UPI0039AF6C3D